MRIMRIRFVVVLLMLCPLIACVSFTCGAGEFSPLVGTNVQIQLHRALSRLNMDEHDLCFEKDLGQPVWALDWIRRSLARPLDLPPVADRILEASAVTNGSHGLWTLGASLLESALPDRRVPVREEALVCEDALNPHLAGYLREFADRAGGALDVFSGAIECLTADERAYAAAAFLGDLFRAEDLPETRAAMLAAGVSSQQVNRVVEEGKVIDAESPQKQVIEMVRRVKLEQALLAGEAFHEAIFRLARQVSAVKQWPEQQVVLKTRIGRIVIGTTGSDVYTNSAVLILDPGGDDLYEGEAGAANGLKGPYLAAVIDLTGNDRYTGTGLMGQGSAVFGLSVLLDVSGDDTYETAYLGQGAALFGAAWLEDGAGADFYKARGFGQAAAIAGLGVLRDIGGNDLYTIGSAGQAYAGIRGAAFLVDVSGDDRYLAGNVEHDWERFEDRYVSLAQGFSIGMRPFAGGGVAALVDLQGNDTYVADVYGQGASYWYSAGFLLDAAGNDTYRVYQYGQGTGIHLSLGLLADLSGNDSYSGLALVQGSAHDYAVGMLFDRSGNDTYSGESSVQARAINNSVALLVDESGNDSYLGGRTEESQGIGHIDGQRRYGSLSVLMDLGGSDAYSCGATNGEIRARPSFGIVYDVETTAGGRGSK